MSVRFRLKQSGNDTGYGCYRLKINAKKLAQKLYFCTAKLYGSRQIYSAIRAGPQRGLHLRSKQKMNDIEQ
jgi:hypothetical protein